MAYYTAREPRVRRLMAERARRFPDSSEDPLPLSLNGHLELLRASGFSAAGVIWSRGDDRLLAGWRPERSGS